jgi:predicted anti-sigma-YlaC factor YlaD
VTRDELSYQLFHHLAGGLTCREAVEAVTEYLEGMMGLPDWVRFQMHLGLCRGCRTYLRQMKLTVRALRALPAAPPSSAVREELLRRFACRKSA